MPSDPATPDRPMRRREPLPNLVDAAIRATSGARAGRRHPADVTADRLVDHAIDERLSRAFTGPERAAIGLVINALRAIAEGNTDRG